MLVDLGAVPAGQTVALVLAQDREPPPGKGDEFGKASPVGLVVIVVLFLATILLVRSMTKHLRRVPATFDKQAEPPADGVPGDGVPGDGVPVGGVPADDVPVDGAGTGTRGDGAAEGSVRD